MDESNATCGKRLDSIGVENTEENRRTYRELLVGAPGLGEFISGAILFEETLYQSAADGTSFVDLLNKQGIVPGAQPPTALLQVRLVVDCAGASPSRLCHWRRSDAVHVSCGQHQSHEGAARCHDADYTAALSPNAGCTACQCCVVTSVVLV